MGALGLVYIVGRAAGKFAGARLATWHLDLDPRVQRFLGFGLQAQAGLAVGLTLAVNSRYPQFAPVVATVPAKLGVARPAWVTRRAIDGPILTYSRRVI